MANKNPAQAKLLLDSFPNSEILLKTFVNNNVDNTWYLQQNDVTLLVDEKPDHISLGLGQTDNRPFYQTGKVKSNMVSVEFGSGVNFDNIAERNKAKAESLNQLANESDDLYEAFVGVFGEDVIIEDNR